MTPDELIWMWVKQRGKALSAAQQSEMRASPVMEVLRRLPGPHVMEAMEQHGGRYKILAHAMWLGSDQHEAFGAILGCGCEVIAAPVVQPPVRQQPKVDRAKPAKVRGGGATVRSKPATDRGSRRGNAQIRTPTPAAPTGGRGRFAPGGGSVPPVPYGTVAKNSW